MTKRKGLYRRGRIWWISYQSLDGSIMRESSGTDKLRGAERLLTKRRNAINEGQEPEVKKIKNYKFRELADQYTIWAKRQRSFDSKKYLIQDWVKAYGNLPLRRFSPMLLEQYQTEKVDSGKKPSTVNRLLATLKHMFTKAVDWELVEEEALKRVRKVKMLPENNQRLRFLSKEECKELLDSCEPHLKPIVVTALNTGMRKNEILKLKWDSVDLKHGFISLELTKNGERRDLPINNTLKSLFRSLFTVRRIDVPYVFHNFKTGKPYGDVKRSFKTALRRTKTHDFKFHDLRHTFASHLVMAGVDLTTVSKLLGHKTLTMTLRYAHLSPKHMVSAVNILDSALNDVPSPASIAANSPKHHRVEEQYAVSSI